jgi:hypothetical protein
LEAVSPDEYRLLRDIAVAGAAALEMPEWADNEFRDAFAHHLERYGLLKFAEGVPTIAIALVLDAMRGPAATDLGSQKRQLRALVDDLETSIRRRIRTDMARGRSVDECVEAIVSTVPSAGAQRSKDRAQLRALGKEVGLQALVEALNWDDYLWVLDKHYDDIQWNGATVDHGDRMTMFRSVVKDCHLVRHNNDTGLRARVADVGFDVLRSRILTLLDAVAA